MFLVAPVSVILTTYPCLHSQSLIFPDRYHSFLFTVTAASDDNLPRPRNPRTGSDLRNKRDRQLQRRLNYCCSCCSHYFCVACCSGFYEHGQQCLRKPSGRRGTWRSCELRAASVITIVAFGKHSAWSFNSREGSIDTRFGRHSSVGLSSCSPTMQSLP